MNLFKIIGTYLELCFLLILKFSWKKKYPPSNNILFINTGKIGDLVVSSLLLENDGNYDDKADMAFLIKEEYADLFKNYHGKIKILTYNHQRYKYSFLYKLHFLLTLKKQNYSSVFNLSAARGIINEELTLLAGTGKTFILRTKSLYLSEKLCRILNNFHTQVICDSFFNEYDKHVHLLKHLNPDSSYNIQFLNKITFSTEEKIVTPDSSKALIVVAPFSSEGNRDWPVSCFHEVIKHLCMSYHIVLIGSIEQRDKIAFLCLGLQNVSNYAGTLSLDLLPTLLNRAELFIGLDSGITHLALRLDKKLISIIGGGMFGRFFPYGTNQKARFVYQHLDCFNCEWICKRYASLCIEGITSEEVISIAEELLNE